MALCGVCNSSIKEVSGQRISHIEFQWIVKNGFNPYNGEIVFGPGFTLTELGLVFKQSTCVVTLYQLWKLNALKSDTERLLCHKCYSLTRRYTKKWWQFWK